MIKIYSNFILIYQIVFEKIDKDIIYIKQIHCKAISCNDIFSNLNKIAYFANPEIFLYEMKILQNKVYYKKRNIKYLLILLIKNVREKCRNNQKPLKISEKKIKEGH